MMSIRRDTPCFYRRAVAVKVLAILQNQWFEDPDRMRDILARGMAKGGKRHDFTARTLFMGCRTGRILKAGLGIEWCRKIVWAEASPEIGGKASSIFPADPAHILAVIVEVKPTVILALGKIAQAGVVSIMPIPGLMPAAIYDLPHPTARGIDAVKFLRNVRQVLDGIEANET